MTGAGCRRGGLGLALVLFAVAAVYLNALGNPFHFDDEHSITANPAVRSLANAPAFFSDPQTFSRNPGSGMLRPLVVLSYAVNYRLGGYEPAGYHRLNLGLHLAVVALVHLLLRQLGAAPATAAAGAALFGLNPLAAEPVNYVSSRSESLALLFVLGAVAFHVRAVRRGRSPALAAAAAACFGAGLLSKEVALAVPALLAAYEWLVAGKGSRTWWRWHLPYWILAAAYGLAACRLIAEAVSGPSAVRPWGAQLATQARALAYYAKLLALPHPLSVESPVREVPAPTDAATILCLLLAGSVAFLGWRWARGAGRRGAGGPGAGLPGAFFGVWMILVLLPTLVVPLNVVAAERRLYPALFGGVGGLLWAVRGARLPHRPILALALLAFAVLTYQRNEVWGSEWALWSDAARRAPAAARPHLRLGIALRQQGRLEEAERALRRALALEPESAPVLNSLGNLYAARGQLDPAAEAYEGALAILPSYPEALANLADLRSRQGRHEDAAVLCERALPLARNRPEVLNNLATAHLRAGRFAAAAEALRRALELDPGGAGTWYNLGGALEGQGETARALEAYGRACQLDSTNAKPYLRLGVLLQQQGETLPAASAYRSFLRYWRGSPEPAAAVRARLADLEAGR